MTVCNSEYCPVIERCLRHVSNYPQGVFERVKTEDLEGVCADNGFVNMINIDNNLDNT